MPLEVNNKPQNFSEANFRARFKVWLSIPWFGGDRIGIMWDRTDRAICFSRWN